MSSGDIVREKIITSTIELIRRSDGDIKNITARAIAELSGAALGLINYHFGSKDNLIDICCSRMISKTISEYSPENNDYSAEDGLTDKQRLISYAHQTFEFLFENRSVVKISILSDLKDYRANSNSALTQVGFMMALRGDIPESDKRRIAFALASVMQAAFLAGDNAGEITGYDLKSEDSRRQFITDTVTMLMEGVT